MRGLERLADEYWQKSNGNGHFDSKFLIFMSALILSACFFTDSIVLGFTLYVLGLGYFILGLFLKALNILDELGEKNINKVSITKSGRRLVIARRKLLRRLLKSRNITTNHVIQAALFTEDINKKFPTIDLDINMNGFLNFIYHPDSKARIITLFVALSALISAFLWSSLSIVEAEKGMSELFLYYDSFLRLIGMFFFIILFITIPSILLFKPLFFTMVISIFPSKKSKMRYLVNSCFQITKIKSLVD